MTDGLLHVRDVIRPWHNTLPMFKDRIWVSGPGHGPVLEVTSCWSITGYVEH